MIGSVECYKCVCEKICETKSSQINISISEQQLGNHNSCDGDGDAINPNPQQKTQG